MVQKAVTVPKQHGVCMIVALLCEINMNLSEENLFLPFLCNSLCLPSILPEANATMELYYKIMLVQKKGKTA